MARVQRDETKERFWRRQVRLWQGSGQTVRVFCQERGLSQPSFYGWRRTLAARDRAAALATPQTRPGRRHAGQEHRGGSAPDFVPVQVVAADTARTAANGSIDLLAAGRVVRITAGFDAATLQRLLHVLEGWPC